MSLCCIENLSSFRSKLDFLQFLKFAQKSGQHDHEPISYSHDDCYCTPLPINEQSTVSLTLAK